MVKSREFGDVLKALGSYMDARQEYEMARDSYDGQDWGYFGTHCAQRMEDAAEDLQGLLEEYISNKVAEAVVKATGG